MTKGLKNMMDLSVKKKATKKQRISVDTPLRSTVESVNWAPGYVPGKAFEVCYKIEDDAGNIQKYSEIFLASDNNDRTQEFYEYLQSNGISDIADFAGCVEQLTFLKDVKNNRAYVNIAKRKFISAPASQLSNVAAP